jgi:hypothetical protein
MNMLDINPDTICNLIGKAREFHAKEEVVIPERPNNPTDDWALQVLADHRDDWTFREMKSTIGDLEPDQQYQLLALVWLGRGDYAIDEWPVAVEEASASWTPTMAEQLIAIPYLADYLDEGLALHGYNCN